MTHNKPYWLIESLSPSGRPGWIREIDRNDAYDVHMTFDSQKAIRFGSKESAEGIIKDTAFQHALGHIHFYATEHLDI